MLGFTDWEGFKAFDVNLPAARPGIYVIQHLVSGKCYVGISGINSGVAGRARSHARGGSPKKLRNALKKYGNSSFVFIPHFYLLDGVVDQLFLQQMESDLIAEYDSIKNGYNVQAACGSVGPYGEEFSEIMKKVLDDPNVRARMGASIKEAHARPDVKLRHSEGLRRAFSTPEAKKRRSKVSKTIWDNSTQEEKAARIDKTAAGNRGQHRSAEQRAHISAQTREAMRVLPDNKKALMLSATLTEEANARKSAAARRRWASEEARRLQSELRLGKHMWITDGATDAHVLASDPIPDGWRAGRSAKLCRGRIWITDGLVSKMVPPDEPLASGWCVGRTIVTPNLTCTGMVWANDGTVSRMIRPPIPIGWYPGRISWRKRN